MHLLRFTFSRREEEEGIGREGGRSDTAKSKTGGGEELEAIVTETLGTGTTWVGDESDGVGETCRECLSHARVQDGAVNSEAF